MNRQSGQLRAFQPGEPPNGEKFELDPSSNSLSFKIGNGMLDWSALASNEVYQLLATTDPLRDQFARRWGAHGTARKVVSGELPNHINKDKAVVLGGICSLFTAESDLIANKQLTFKSIGEFRSWMSSWYPRLDQVHDAVGIPPRGTPRIIYVVEDSIFARRIAKHTDLESSALSEAIRDIHETQGKSVVDRWLRNGGYKGAVEVVYTSDIEPQMSFALRAWTKYDLQETFQRKHEDRLKVNLMYTGWWPTLLGIDEAAVIFEPCTHGLETDFFPKLRSWKELNSYGTGINRDVGLLGFLPFRLHNGYGREQPLSTVANAGNWRGFEVPENDLPLYALNFWPKLALDKDFCLKSEEIRRRVRMDLENIYG